ncbi:hypothetical protein V8E53_006785 [Lactarius tabidus]
MQASRAFIAMLVLVASAFAPVLSTPIELNSCMTYWQGKTRSVGCEVGSYGRQNTRMIYQLSEAMAQPDAKDGSEDARIDHWPWPKRDTLGRLEHSFAIRVIHGPGLTGAILSARAQAPTSPRLQTAPTAETQSFSSRAIYSHQYEAASFRIVPMDRTAVLRH